MLCMCAGFTHEVAFPWLRGWCYIVLTLLYIIFVLTFHFCHHAYVISYYIVIFIEYVCVHVFMIIIILIISYYDYDFDYDYILCIPQHTHELNIPIFISYTNPLFMSL